MTIPERTQGSLEESALESDTLAPHSKKQRTDEIDLERDECDDIEEVDENEPETEVAFVQSETEASNHGMIMVPMPVDKCEQDISERSKDGAQESCEVCEVEEHQQEADNSEPLTETASIEEAQVAVIELLSDDAAETEKGTESESGSM